MAAITLTLPPRTLRARQRADPKKLEAARRELVKATGALRTAKLVGLGTGTVQRLNQASVGS